MPITLSRPISPEGRFACALEGHSALVNAVAMLPDGRCAVSATWDNTLVVWDLETGKGIARFICESHAFCCACTDASTIVAGDGGGRIYLLALEIQNSPTRQ